MQVTSHLRSETGVPGMGRHLPSPVPIPAQKAVAYQGEPSLLLNRGLSRDFPPAYFYLRMPTGIRPFFMTFERQKNAFRKISEKNT
jgi:hypothetical protein